MKIADTLHDLKTQGIDIADPSSITDFLRCARYFQHRHEEGLSRLDTTPGYGLQFGISLHKALADWYINRDTQKAIDIFKVDFMPFQEPSTFHKRSGKELPATYTIIYGCSLLLLYFTHYAKDTRKVLEVEIPLADELADNIYLVGRIDLILDDNPPVFVDHKSTKYPDRFNINPNLQFMAYKFLCSKLTGKDIAGELDLLVVAKTKDPQDLLFRRPFDYSKDQMSAWQESVMSHMTAIRACRASGFWPQSWRCLEYFQKCAYLPLCTSPRQDSAMKLKETMYTVSFWNPLQIGA